MPYKHGHCVGSKSMIWRRWDAMKLRCSPKNKAKFDNYCGRGIRVCDEWMESFEKFRDYVYENLGEPPTPMHQIDRIDNDKNYEPGNLRWATPREQNYNNRQTLWIEWDGLVDTTDNWAKKIGVTPSNLRWRIYNWSKDKAMTQPPRKNPGDPEFPIIKDYHKPRRS